MTSYPQPGPAGVPQRLADALAHASKVFGSDERAQAWLNAPAMGLDHRRPSDLLQTSEGADLVTDFLIRLEHNVYS